MIHPRAAFKAWRRAYNKTRPHLKLGWLAP
ncbi:integrase core domain-containing protein [Brevundimonas vesicularis]